VKKQKIKISLFMFHEAFEVNYSSGEAFVEAEIDEEGNVSEEERLKIVAPLFAHIRRYLDQMS